MKLETNKQLKPLERPILLGVLFSVLLVGTSLLLLFYPFPSLKKTDYFTVKHPIIYQSKVYKDGAVVRSETVYLPINVLRKVDPTIAYDEKSKSIIIVKKNKVMQMPTDALTYFVNNKPVNIELPAVITQNGNIYVALEPLASIYNWEIKMAEETGAILLFNRGDILMHGIAKKNETKHYLRLRTKADMRSPYVAALQAGERVYIEKEKEDFYFVRKENGIAGYVKKEAVRLDKPELIAFSQPNKQITANRLSLPIYLAWEAVYQKNPEVSEIPAMPGVNVVSPTWFKLKNGNGDVTNLASIEYVKWAKKRKYQVWGLFGNGFNPRKTHDALKDFETRQKIIRQLLQYSQMYSLNGINIDFENVNVEDGPLVTQFVREAAAYLHQAGLVVSMDITFISESGNWSKFYEREKLADIVDYLVVMAYDEHWETSPKAGSVASLPWVEKNLSTLLNVVPADRLILGVPLYTRIWKEQRMDDGSIKVSSKALSMDEAREWIKQRKLQPVYDERTGQNYVEYYDQKEDATYKIWLEDGQSLTSRIQLVRKYSLAGIAVWSREFASKEAWIAMNEALNKKTVANKR